MSATLQPWASLARPDYRGILESLGLSPKVARSVARAWPNPGALSGATPGLLRALGLTPAQIRRLLGAVELARLAHHRGPVVMVESPGDVAALVGPALATAEREILAVLTLDGRCRVIDVAMVAMGTSTSVGSIPREIFRDAIRAGAASVILAHNHPGGDPEPSDGDVGFTQRMSEAGRLLGIPVLDHVVIGRAGEFRSLAEEGFLEAS